MSAHRFWHPFGHPSSYLRGIHARAMSALAAVAFACAAASSTYAQVAIALRGGEADLNAVSAEASVRGLEIVVATGRGTTRSEVLPWDRVRSVTLATGRHPAFDYLATAEELWRARIRVARGDTRLAAPILAKHWITYRDLDGATAQLVAEGWLRCALADGDSANVIDAWIACMRHQAAGAETRFLELPALLDASTGLLPTLSPFAPSGIRASVIARCDAAIARSSGSQSSTRVDAATTLQRFTRLARAADLTAALNAAPESAPSNGGKSAASQAARVLEALEAIATAVDARALDRATAEFDRAFAEPKPFLAAWRLAAIGAGKARLARAAAEPDRVAALAAAALELLAVPASRLDPAGVVDAYAVESAAILMREAGDAQTAEQLERLLAEMNIAKPMHAPEREPLGRGRGLDGGAHERLRDEISKNAHDHAHDHARDHAPFKPSAPRASTDLTSSAPIQATRL
jgi:hypothetical protein